MGMDSIVRWSRVVADLLALGLAGFAIYVAGFGVFDEVWVRAGTTGLPILISILYFSSESLDVKREDVRVGSVVLNAIFFAGFFLIYYLWITLMTEQMDFFVEFTTFDYAVGFMGVGLIFYLTLRHFGVPLFLVCLLSLLILFFGNLIPGTLNIPEVKWFLISEKLWYSTDGVFGRPVAVVGQIVLVFILFGAILEASGAGATLLKFAFAVTGPAARRPGSCRHRRQRQLRDHERGGRRKRGNHGRFHYPDDQAHRIPAEVRRRRGGDRLVRRPDHAAGDGRRRLPDGRHHGHPLPRHHRRRGHPGADVLLQPFYGGVARGPEDGPEADPQVRARKPDRHRLDPLDFLLRAAGRHRRRPADRPDGAKRRDSTG